MRYRSGRYERFFSPLFITADAQSHINCVRISQQICFTVLHYPASLNAARIQFVVRIQTHSKRTDGTSKNRSKGVDNDAYVSLQIYLQPRQS